MATIQFFTHTDDLMEEITLSKGDIRVTEVHEDGFVTLTDIDLIQEAIFENCQDLKPNIWYDCNIYIDNDGEGDYWYVSENFIESEV